ncbi:hypothetical protein UNDYM_0589 [Undibacterium sp. YM2]|nr:hypothetical protein UNDYM_0589 [Undibacterium sp. YM2]
MPIGILRLELHRAKLKVTRTTGVAIELMTTDPPGFVTDVGIAAAYAKYAGAGNGIAITVPGIEDVVAGYGPVLHISS